jgi:hypothetical protein
MGVVSTAAPWSKTFPVTEERALGETPYKVPQLRPHERTRIQAVHEVRLTCTGNARQRSTFSNSFSSWSCSSRLAHHQIATDRVCEEQLGSDTIRVIQIEFILQ